MEGLRIDLGYEVVKHNDLTGKVKTKPVSLKTLTDFSSTSALKSKGLNVNDFLQQILCVSQEIDKALIVFSHHPKLTVKDSVFVVIMSSARSGDSEIMLHSGLVYWGSNKPSNVLQVDQVYKHLNSENCPALLNKPKIIIIQTFREGDSPQTHGYLPVHHDVDPEYVQVNKGNCTCSVSVWPGRMTSYHVHQDETWMGQSHKEKNFISLVFARKLICATILFLWCSMGPVLCTSLDRSWMKLSGHVSSSSSRSVPVSLDSCD